MRGWSKRLDNLSRRYCHQIHPDTICCEVLAPGDDYSRRKGNPKSKTTRRQHFISSDISSISDPTTKRAPEMRLCQSIIDASVRNLVEGRCLRTNFEGYSWVVRKRKDTWWTLLNQGLPNMTNEPNINRLSIDWYRVIIIIFIWILVVPQVDVRATKLGFKLSLFATGTVTTVSTVR
jgi:hypothetical protein